MSTVRYSHSSVLLPNGKVLVAGGSDANNLSLASAELYDTVTGVWSTTGSMNSPRSGHTLTLLLNGKVLAAGGANKEWIDNVATAELYNPETGTWTRIANMNSAHKAHIAVMLPNGKVLIAGGGDSSGGSIRSNVAEIYDPTSGSWTATAMNIKRYMPVVILLSNGKVLVAGGSYAAGVNTASAELYDTNTGTWSNTASMSAARAWFAGANLPNGKALVAGGCGNTCSTILNTAELYDPVSATWSCAASLNAARADFALTLLPNGKVLATGGFNGIDPIKTAELYTPEAIPTTTNLSSSSNPSVIGQSVTFTAVVTDTNVTPSGTLTFKVDDAIKQVNSLDNGQATYTTTFSAVGNYSVKAEFSGNTVFAASSNQLTQTVNVSSYTVTSSAGTGGIISPNTPQTVSNGATVNFTVTPNDDYDRNNIVGGNCPQGSWNGNVWTTGPIVADCAVNFSFTFITYKVTPSAGTGGSISPNTQQTVTRGFKTTFTITPNSDYVIAAVSGCGGTLAGNIYTTAAITAACSVTATFNPIITGACGSSNGGTFAAAPTTNLCNRGTASAVTGTGPWNWSCAGSNGGTTANCSANITTYTVTPSATTTPVGASGGSFFPEIATPVNAGTTTSFSVIPATNSGGYTTNTAVTGTCPQGSWGGTWNNIWTTGPISANCTVVFGFTAVNS